MTKPKTETAKYTVQKESGESLADFETIKNIFTDVFPEIEFRWTQSGEEKIQMAEAGGMEIPNALREKMLAMKSEFMGLSGGAGILEVKCGDVDPPKCIHLISRGRVGVLDEEINQVVENLGAILVPCNED